MPLPLYQGLHAPQRPDSANMNMGLWFERYFDGYAADFAEVSQEQRTQWLRQLATKQLGSSSTLERKVETMQALAQAQGGQVRQYHCAGNFVTGMGNPHPLENGFTWHPTLGMPYLPGSTVKGLVRAAIENAYQGEDKAAVLKRWFGTETKGDVAEASGCFIFFDALPTAPYELLPEVMTPHMGKWYEKGGKDPMGKDTQPGDWHSPVPVGYLVARNLKLQFAIAPRAGALAGQDMASELDNVWQALDYALQWLGAGGKTALGYGRMLSEHQKQALHEAAAERVDGVRLKYNRANGALTAETREKKPYVALKDKADTLLQTLPTALQQKIKTNQCFDKFTAYVDGTDLLRLEQA